MKSYKKKFNIEITCNKCGSKNVRLILLDNIAECKCQDCDEFDEVL